MQQKKVKNWLWYKMNNGWLFFLLFSDLQKYLLQ